MTKETTKTLIDVNDVVVTETRIKHSTFRLLQSFIRVDGELRHVSDEWHMFSKVPGAAHRMSAVIRRVRNALAG